LVRLDSLTANEARQVIRRLVYEKEHPMEYPPGPREGRGPSGEDHRMEGLADHPDDAPRPALHDSTFDYLKPTEKQMHDMEQARAAAATYADVLEELLPPGPDKTYALRKVREVAMWANVAITREADGAPRQ
jgi:hypothetical protein